MNAIIYELLQKLQAEVTRNCSAGNRAIFIWGAGRAGQQAARVLNSLKSQWVGFIDSDPAKCGSIIKDRPVYCPKELQNYAVRPFILIASMYHQEIEKQLKKSDYRPEQDFKIFPSDEVSFFKIGKGIQIYNIWRQIKIKRDGYVFAGVNGTPPIDLIPVDKTVCQKLELSNIEKHLPQNNEKWVCLYDSECRIVKWYWRKSDSILSEFDVSIVRVDLLPLRKNGSDSSFLPSFFAFESYFSDKIIACRTRVVRDFLSEMKHSSLTLQNLKKWVVERFPVRFVDGMCQILVDTEIATGFPFRQYNHRKFSFMHDFIHDLGSAGIPLFTVSEAEKELSLKNETDLLENAGIEHLYAKTNPQRKLKLQIISHSQGNFFFSEIRDFLAACWRKVGVEVVVGNERTKRRGSSWRTVVIAPHEFKILKNNSILDRNEGQTVFINTEQPHTRWFSAALPFLLNSRLVFDLNWQTCLLLRKFGINAHFLPLGVDEHAQITKPRRMMPLKEAIRGMVSKDRALITSMKWDNRPIDILFVGTMSQRRSDFFARNADIFAKHRCFFHIPPGDRPISRQSPDCLNSRDMADLCRRSKIVLNIHRDELSYCEWHRIFFHALRQSALVVTEPMMTVPRFKSNKDFIESSIERIAYKVHRILTNNTKRQQAKAIARHGESTFRDNFSALKIARSSRELFFSFGL